MSHMKASMVERDIEDDGNVTLYCKGYKPPCPVCRGTGSVPSEHGPMYPYSCPNCNLDEPDSPQQYP